MPDVCMVQADSIAGVGSSALPKAKKKMKKEKKNYFAVYFLHQ